MAVKGAIAKQDITKKILEVFPGSFLYDKEIRVPMIENGETVQIKITLTAAKVAVEAGGDNAVPGVNVQTAAPAVNGVSEITEDERAEVNDLISKLGL